MTRVVRSMAVLVGLITGLGAAAGALPAAAQTPGGSTTTTTSPTTTPTTTSPTPPKASGGNVSTQAACVASDNATYLAAIATASTGGCGATTQVITITASITLAGTQGNYQNAGNAPLTINGGGFTIDANGLSRILTSNASVTTINNLTLTHGVDAATPTGGAIRISAASGNVIINGCTFVQNTAVQFFGGAAGGGAISVGGGDITVTNSTFNDNHTFFDGGAIRSHRPGSATSHIPVVTITGSTFQQNSAVLGDGGAIYSDGFVFATNSTVTGNDVVVGGHGGGITAAGINLAYTDVVGNTAGTAGNGSDLGIRHLHAVGGSVPGAVNTFGSVITADPSTAQICSFDFPPANGTSFGYNWMSDNSCFPGGSATPATTDAITTADPQLGPLANNGGPTLTELPAATSPLVDRIPLAACQTAPLATGVTTDQRGLARPSGFGCDVGAVEIQVPAAAVELVPRFTG